MIYISLQLSIIIVNFNVKYFLEQCLSSVIKALNGIESEILVVDNNSSDGSKEFFAGRFPGVVFIWNNQNYGFAKANNQALGHASGEYILFLNPDTIVQEDSLVKCMAFLKEHANRGALGIRMLDGGGNFLKESKRAFPSPQTSLYKLSGITQIFPHSKTFASYHLGHLNDLENHEVDVLAGAFMMIPHSIIKKIGAFDEKFFMYGEDVDLSFRIQKAGYKNYYYAGSSILHFKGESTKKGSLNYVKLFYKAMIIFVQKHYGGTRAGLFTSLIQLAIMIRGFVSAIGKFIKWIGMPFIDAGIILMSFWLIKIWWNAFIKRDVSYSSNLLIIAFPVFTLVFLATSYYSGLYDNGYKQSRLNKSTLSALLILLSGYALLPEYLRFSRGILVFGTFMAFMLITLLRWFLVKWQVIESADEDDEHRQTIIVGTKKEFKEAHELMQMAGMGDRVLGRVDVNGGESNAIGNLKQLKFLIEMYPIREVVLCQGKLSFVEVIDTMKSIPSRLRIKFHAQGTQSIIGSDSKHETGKIVSAHRNMKLGNSINRRNKRVTAVIVSLIFLITFPIHLACQHKPLLFFKNVFAVLFLRMEWVGYATTEMKLPPLNPGLLTTTGLPTALNLLPLQSLKSTDEWYAADYHVMKDVWIVWKGYKHLS